MSFREPVDLLALKRNYADNITREAKEDRKDAPSDTRFQKARAFLEHQVVRWASFYLRTRLGRRIRFKAHARGEGVTPLSAPSSPSVRVGMAGDWGTGTADADAVGTALASTDPHFTVHLGDVYYMGSDRRMYENMLGRRFTKWPKGSHGTFALNGNHEMYARGKGYFEVLLPAIGPTTSNGPGGQGASYFALRNDHWLIVGLDTGYNSVGFPVLEKLGIGGSTEQRKEVLNWLEHTVGIHTDQTRGIILLSHHQYYSAFEDSHEASARQLVGLIKRPVLWFWGHEHRLAFYGATSYNNGLVAIGRCVGHGGMPIEGIEDRPRTRPRGLPLVAYDHRRRTTLGNTPVGFNGFVNLEFNGPRVRIDYWEAQAGPDEAPITQRLVTEHFEVGAGGKLKGKGISPVGADSTWLHDGEDWARAQP